MARGARCDFWARRPKGASQTWIHRDGAIRLVYQGTTNMIHYSPLKSPLININRSLFTIKITMIHHWSLRICWLVVGPPLWKIWVRQLGWWMQPNINGTIKLMATKPPTRKFYPATHGYPISGHVFFFAVSSLVFVDWCICMLWICVFPPCSIWISGCSDLFIFSVGGCEDVAMKPLRGSIGTGNWRTEKSARVSWNPLFQRIKTLLSSW